MNTVLLLLLLLIATPTLSLQTAAQTTTQTVLLPPRLTFSLPAERNEQEAYAMDVTTGEVFLFRQGASPTGSKDAMVEVYPRGISVARRKLTSFVPSSQYPTFFGSLKVLRQDSATVLWAIDERVGEVYRTMMSANALSAAGAEAVAWESVTSPAPFAGAAFSLHLVPRSNPEYVIVAESATGALSVWMDNVWHILTPALLPLGDYVFSMAMHNKRVFVVAAERSKGEIYQLKLPIDGSSTFDTFKASAALSSWVKILPSLPLSQTQQMNACEFIKVFPTDSTLDIVSVAPSGEAYYWKALHTASTLASKPTAILSRACALNTAKTSLVFDVARLHGGTFALVGMNTTNGAVFTHTGDWRESLKGYIDGEHIERERDKSYRKRLNSALNRRRTNDSLEALRLLDLESRAKQSEDSLKTAQNEISKAQQEIAVLKADVQREQLLSELCRKSGFAASISNVIGRYGDSSVIKPTIVIEEFPQRQVRPLLPYIFFDKNSAVLSSRYRQITGAVRNSFSVEHLAGEKGLTAYYQILNVVGKRMSDMPQAKLTIIGCNDNTDSEANNLRLSQQRAVAVSDYLQTVWKIPAKRLEIKAQNLPTSINTTAVGDSIASAEHRRVELQASHAEILQPLVAENSRYIVAPAYIEMNLDIFAGAGLKEWSLEVTQIDGMESRIIHSAKGEKSYPPKYLWELQDAKTNWALTNMVDIRLEVTDVNNNVIASPIVSLPLRKMSIADKQKNTLAETLFDVYELLSFHSTEPELQADTATLRLIHTIASGLKGESAVSVAAYTTTQGGGARSFGAGLSNAVPKLPLAAQKLNLSKPRLATVADPYDNSFPEGRFYNRAVRVEVQTPVQARAGK